MSEDIIDEATEETTTDTSPLEVTIKKEETKPEPSFDYDDYLPSTEEILEAEKEIHENTQKRQVKNT